MKKTILLSAIILISCTQARELGEKTSSVAARHAELYCREISQDIRREYDQMVNSKIPNGRVIVICDGDTE